MAFGILESSRTPQPPGTAFLADNENSSPEAGVFTPLKHGTGRNAHIVLVPQPSDSPNDPLNWPLWRKDLIILFLMFSTMAFAGAIGPALSSFALQLTLQYQVSFTQVSLLTGWELLTVAICGFLVSPLARTFGKRPVMLACSLIGWAGSMVLIYADSYNHFLAGRILQGVGVSVYESLGFSIVADLYCVHERGARVAAYLIPLGAINILCPLISGVVAQNLGIPMVYKLLALFTGLATLAVFFGIPETTYNRDPVFNARNTSTEDPEVLKDMTEVEMTEDVTKTTPGDESHDGSDVPKRSYFQMLSVYNGRFVDESPIRVMARCVFTLLNPAVLWSCLTQGAISAWTVAVSFMLSQIFAAPPYNLSPAQVAYLFGGACVGGTIAEILCIALNDRMAKLLARLNRGIYEPEFRLWIIIPMAITGTIGFFGFGQSIVAGKGPIVASMFYGFITASLIFSHVASGSYISDAYKELAIENFIDVMIFKNLLFFLFSFFVNKWLMKDGAEAVFNTIGGVQLAICALSIPLYVLGKRSRAWWHRSVAKMM